MVMILLFQLITNNNFAYEQMVTEAERANCGAVNNNGNYCNLKVINSLTTDNLLVQSHCVLNDVTINGMVNGFPIEDIQGAPGKTGATGAQGATGTTGATGITGAGGATGATGQVGTQGAKGTTGATGPAGINGTAGATGATGANGVQGNPGIIGNTGATGVTGEVGAQGPIGITGATGPAGLNGSIGATGATGASGLAQLGAYVFAFNPNITGVVTVTGSVAIPFPNTPHLVSITHPNATDFIFNDDGIYVVRYIVQATLSVATVSTLRLELNGAPLAGSHYHLTTTNASQIAIGQAIIAAAPGDLLHLTITTLLPLAALSGNGSLIIEKIA